MILQKAKKHCWFCMNNIKVIDYKNTGMLQKFVSSYFRIAPKRKSGTCARHQRQLATAVKRSRYMALMPYVPHHQ